MKKTFVYKFVNIITTLAFFVLLQFIQYEFLFEDISFPIYWYLDVLLVLALSSIVLLFKSKLFDKIYLPIIYGLIVTFTLVNVNFYNTTGDIFSLTNLMLVDNAMNVAASAAAFNIPLTVLGVVSVIVFTLLLIFNDLFFFKTNKFRLKREGRINRFPRIFFATLIVLFSFGFYSFSFISKVNENNTKNTIMLEKVSNFKDYGMLSYYMQEAPYIINGARVNSKVEEDLKTFFTNEQYQKNSYSGLLKDYNVVTICVETGDDLMLNETLAPNLYQLFNDSINFERNYSKNKTNMSEFVGFAGSAPVAGINPKYDYKLPFSLPYILDNNGYETMYFHDAPTDKDVYKRRELMPKLNFKHNYFREDLFPNEPGWDFSGSYSFDSVMMPKVADTILEFKDKPIYAFYMTLSMHGPYDEPRNHDILVKNYGDKYYKAVNEGKFINPLKGTINEHCVDNYMMAVMDFDKGLGELIKKFKDNNEYDNTLFVLYGDHEMYYIGADGVPLNKTLANTMDMANSSMYRTMMCFSNPTLKQKWGNQKYDQFTSPYNIVPTVLDLIGYEYNPNYYIGDSLFSPKMKNTQAFYTLEQAGFFNEDYWAINHKNIYREFNKGDKEGFLKAVTNICNKESRLDIIYTSNFFTKRDFKDYTN